MGMAQILPQSLRKEPILQAPWFQTSGFQTSGRIHCCWWSHPLCILCYCSLRNHIHSPPGQQTSAWCQVPDLSPWCPPVPFPRAKSYASTPDLEQWIFVWALRTIGLPLIPQQLLTLLSKEMGLGNQWGFEPVPFLPSSAPSGALRLQPVTHLSRNTPRPAEQNVWVSAVFLCLGSSLSQTHTLAHVGL